MTRIELVNAVVYAMVHFAPADPEKLTAADIHDVKVVLLNDVLNPADASIRQADFRLGFAAARNPKAGS